MRKTLVVVTAALGLLWSLPARADVTLVMVRHGEKPAEGRGQLTCQGLNRSLALPEVLASKYGKPDAVYAPNPGLVKKDGGTLYSYIRPLATIEPTAIRFGLPVGALWGFNDIASLQDEVLRPAHAGQTVFIAWEHHLLDDLARNVLTERGGEPALVPRWDDADFDSIYVVTLPSIGAATFRVDHEGLNGLSTRCPGVHQP